MEDVTVFKIVSIVTIWLFALIGGMLPNVIASLKNPSHPVLYAQVLMNAFSGGVFLAGGFLHLLHDALENAALQNWSRMNGGKYTFPYAELFCSIGFLCLFIVEQGAHEQVCKHKRSSEYQTIPDPKQYWNAGEEELSETFHDPNHLHSIRTNTSLAVSMVLFIGLSFHSIMEGLGIGAQHHTAWGVLFAILVHKGLAAFALATGLLQSNQLRFSSVVAYICMFSLMSIVGILIGWIFAGDASKHSAAAGICVALASGTFIYVAVMEVLPPLFSQNGMSDRVSRWEKMIAVCFGYAVFGLLAKWV